MNTNHTVIDNPDDILECIRDVSRIGYNEKCSIVDRVLDAKWCEDCDLVSAYKILEGSNLDIVVVFFQTPFLVRFPDKWIKIPSEYGHPYIHFRPIGTACNKLNREQEFKIKERENFHEIESFQNATLPSDPYGFLIRSQVLASFQLWEPRRKYYRKYLELVSAERDFDSFIIVPREKSWIPDSRPMNAGIYEVDISRRLYKQMLLAFNNFVVPYSVACRDPYANKLEYLCNFFIMTKLGRIVVATPGKSTVVQYVREFVFEDYAQSVSELQRWLKSGRSPSTYERYLLEAVRLVETDSINLAVVQSVMILDWFANEIIENRLVKTVENKLKDQHRLFQLVVDRLWETPSGRSQWGTRIPTIEKFVRYFPIIGVRLPSNLEQQLREVIELRNNIVHRTQTKAIEKFMAKNCINIAMNVVKHCMDCLVEAEHDEAVLP